MSTLTAAEQQHSQRPTTTTVSTTAKASSSHTSAVAEAQQEDIMQIIQQQRAFFATRVTLSVDFRLEQLRALQAAVRHEERTITEALYADLRKPETEAYLSEVYFVLEELKHNLRYLRSWVRPERASVPLPLVPATARVESVPYGTTLIISPWNYPFQLLIAPLIAAISAGNTAVLKPSELAPATSSMIASLIKRTFSPEYVAVVEGGVPTNSFLLEQRWDYIFFTGGTEVGRIVAQAAAKHLTPTTLELGGKSPCVVCADANLDVAARRVAWGKYFNAGQTCIAPDYVLVDKRIEQAFIERLRNVVQEFFGSAPEHSPDYARIINERHFQRLSAYLADGDVCFGGQTLPDERYIAPTALVNVSPESRVMRDEIFGPILPILSFTHLNDAITFIQERPHPLALYLFTGSKRTERFLLDHTTSGGVCVNSTIMHISVPNAPFGGVGESGIGAYHGKYGFDTFSHKRTVMRKPTLVDLKFAYAPYGDRIRWLKRFL